MNSLKLKRQIIEDPSSEDLKDICVPLYNFNLAQPGFNRWKEFVYKYHDENQKLIGGINWGMRGEWLIIDNIFIVESYRKMGLGKTMMNDVETEAIARGCTKALVDTWEFQSPGFYLKLGYKIAFTQEYKDRRSNEYRLVKDLTEKSS